MSKKTASNKNSNANIIQDVQSNDELRSIKENNNLTELNKNDDENENMYYDEDIDSNSTSEEAFEYPYENDDHDLDDYDCFASNPWIFSSDEESNNSIKEEQKKEEESSVNVDENELKNFYNSDEIFNFIYNDKNLFPGYFDDENDSTKKGDNFNENFEINKMIDYNKTENDESNEEDDDDDDDKTTTSNKKKNYDITDFYIRSKQDEKEINENQMENEKISTLLTNYFAGNRNQTTNNSNQYTDTTSNSQSQNEMNYELKNNHYLSNNVYPLNKKDFANRFYNFKPNDTGYKLLKKLTVYENTYGFEIKKVHLDPFKQNFNKNLLSYKKKKEINIYKKPLSHDTIKEKKNIERKLAKVTNEENNYKNIINEITEVQVKNKK